MTVNKNLETYIRWVTTWIRQARLPVLCPYLVHPDRPQRLWTRTVHRRSWLWRQLAAPSTALHVFESFRHLSARCTTSWRSAFALMTHRFRQEHCHRSLHLYLTTKTQDENKSGRAVGLADAVRDYLETQWVGRTLCTNHVPMGRAVVSRSKHTKAIKTQNAQ